jgi:hypothetical protein
MTFLTSGEIARRLNVGRDRVVYAIHRWRIEPQGTAGNVEIYTESDMNTIRDFVNRKEHRNDTL